MLFSSIGQTGGIRGPFLETRTVGASKRSMLVPAKLRPAASHNPSILHTFVVEIIILVAVLIELLQPGISLSEPMKCATKPIAKPIMVRASLLSAQVHSKWLLLSTWSASAIHASMNDPTLKQGVTCCHDPIAIDRSMAAPISQHI